MADLEGLKLVIPSQDKETSPFSPPPRDRKHEVPRDIAPQPEPKPEEPKIEIGEPVVNEEPLFSAVGYSTGTADIVNFPFLAIIGQEEMKLALMLAVINPAVNGVVLIGPRGTAKTTAVRGLIDLMPPIRRSICPYGCEPEAAYERGWDAICLDCQAKLRAGEPITYEDRMRLVELPLNARLDDVVGGINQRAALEQNRVILERGILSYADRNVLYIDEINLLDNVIVDAVLDAAAQGHYTVRRGALIDTYQSRLTIIGSMNPEEGLLRPQLMDRFGLRVFVWGLRNTQNRLEAYQRVHDFHTSPHAFVTSYAAETAELTEEIRLAQELLPQVELSPEAEQLTMELIESLQIASHRAEIVTFEAARTYAAADGRLQVTPEDVAKVAPLALQLRRSEFAIKYCEERNREREQIDETIAKITAKYKSTK